MSCIFRIKQKSGSSTELNYVVEVLAGANTEKMRKRFHDQLTTYGIGKDTPRARNGPRWGGSSSGSVSLMRLRTATRRSRFPNKASPR